jgi:hypothetical protein
MNKCKELEDKAIEISDEHHLCGSRILGLALKNQILEKRNREVQADLRF